MTITSSLRMVRSMIATWVLQRGEHLGPRTNRHGVMASISPDCQMSIQLNKIQKLFEGFKSESKKHSLFDRFPGFTTPKKPRDGDASATLMYG